MKAMLRQSFLLLALACLHAVGQALYYRDKVSWQSPVAASDMVTLAQVRAWGGNAIWVDAHHIEHWADGGATELGDGKPVLILDAVTLTSGAGRPRPAELVPPPPLAMPEPRASSA